jgi:hypothetical protein
LWSRLDGFEREHLTTALERKKVVQGTMMRATIHMALLVPARRTQILPERYRPLVFDTKTPHSVTTFLR